MFQGVDWFHCHLKLLWIEGGEGEALRKPDPEKNGCMVSGRATGAMLSSLLHALFASARFHDPFFFISAPLFSCGYLIVTFSAVL
ncbi:MAG: hypothetical protein KJ804_18240 [Proteobacteria bacterium]|nr:hypothetical protein [Pseudomonadota bacterium]